MPFKFKSGVPMLDAWMLLNQTYDNISYCKDKLSVTTGITRQQSGILMAIKFIDPPPTETQIAAWIDKKLNSVSTILDRMEKAGLVERRSDPQDRRTIRLRVTEKGEASFKVDVVHRCAQIKEIMGSLTEEEILSLIRLLEKVRLQALRQLHQDKSLKEVIINDTDPVVQCLRSSKKK
jgi:DNA-binding MarR family transcriptional regulator